MSEDVDQVADNPTLPTETIDQTMKLSMTKRGDVTYYTLGSKLINSDLFAGKPEAFQVVRGKFEPESFVLARPNGAKATLNDWNFSHFAYCAAASRA